MFLKLFRTGILFFSMSTAGAVVNDLPITKFSCREANNGVIVHDGAKTLTISQDQFGTYYLGLIQKDQFAGDQQLVDNLPIEQQKCSGFLPCVLFRGIDPQGQLDLEFFINFMKNTELQEGHLKLRKGKEPISADFLCKEK